MNQHTSFYMDGTLSICREGDVFLGNAQFTLIKGLVLRVLLK